MKKLPVCMIAVMLMLTIITPEVSAKTDPKEATDVALSPEDAEKVNVLVSRLEEIKAMDKSDLKSSEKKTLRKEVREIKSELKSLGSGGVYLSVGAIIIIILLLILLL